MQNAYYHDFFQKALVPAGMSDKKAFLDTLQDNEEVQLPTHLLIGIEGREMESKKHYHWKISVFTADINGIFNACKPIFSSPFYEHFDEVMEAARTIEKEVREDLLHTHQFEEKIS